MAANDSLSNFATIGWWSDLINFGVSDAQLQGIMNHIKAVGYSGITFDYSVIVGADGTVLNTEANTRMLTEIDYAKSIGLSVATKVHWTLDGQNLNTWTTPATFNADKFFAGVDAYFKSFSPIAQAHGVEMQYLGTESDNFMASQYLEQWTQIVNNIRAVYAGEISYDGNFMGRIDDPFNQIAIWGLVDKIGLSFYPALSQFPVSSLEQLISLFKQTNPTLSNPLNQSWGAAYSSIVDEIQSLSAQHGKKVILAEVNYQAISNNLHGYVPEDTLISSNTSVNHDAATLAYRALFNILENNLSGVVVGETLYGYDPWQYADFRSSTYGRWIPYSQLSGTTTEQALSEIFAQQKTGVSLLSTITYGGDTYTGGPGINTVTYAGDYSTYAVKELNGKLSVTDHSNVKGVDTLVNIQRLQFSDTNFALDIAPTDHAGSIYMIYQAAFNRKPDVAGLGYWIDVVDKGANIVTNVAQAFIASPEFVAKYGSNPTNASYVDNLYLNVLHRSGDAGGVVYWNQELNAGRVTKAAALEAFATLPEGASLVAADIAHGIQYQQWAG